MSDDPADALTLDELEEPNPSPDPDHPCPNCDTVPLASSDGFGRRCLSCGYTWTARDGPVADPNSWQFWSIGDSLTAVNKDRMLLASWNRKTDPAQVALQDYLRGLAEDIGPLPASPLAIAIEVKLKSSDELLRGHDLENYLTPIAHRLGVGWLRYARATKRLGTGPSSIIVSRAVPADRPKGEGWSGLTIQMTGSAQQKDWKARLRQALIDREVARLPKEVPVEIVLAWRGARRRNWINLWKATGDSLEPILGAPHPDFPYKLFDDRITILELHWNPLISLSSDLDVGIWWRATDADRHS